MKKMSGMKKKKNPMIAAVNAVSAKKMPYDAEEGHEDPVEEMAETPSEEAAEQSKKKGMKKKK